MVATPPTMAVKRAATPQRWVDALPGGLPPVRIPSRARQNCGSNPGSPRHASPRLHKGPRWDRRSLLLLLKLALVLALGLLATRHASNFHGSLHYGAGSPSRKRHLIATADGRAELQQLRQPSVEQQQQQHQQGHAFPWQAQVDDTRRDGSTLSGGAGSPLRGGISMFPAASSLSSVLAHPTSGPQGQPTTYFYRFTNVRVQSSGIEFYGGPGFVPPAEEWWYDVVRGNSTSPRPPTALVLQDGDAAAGGAVRHIPVRYLPAAMPATACRRWVEPPALLLHTRFPHNMWHSWAEGLMPAFHTLRELGYLQVMEVDGAGGVREVAEGVPSGACPLVHDPATGAARAADECYQTAAPVSAALSSCNLTDTRTAWCMPGVWAPSLSAAKPALLYSSPAVVDNEWGSLYTAMAGSVEHMGDAGAGLCVRNLVVGTSRSLTLAEPLLPSGEMEGRDGGSAAAVEALDVFSRFTRSALHRLAMNNAIEFEGYAGEATEKLRAGITIGRGGILDLAFQPSEAMVTRPTPEADQAWLDDWEDLQQLPWLFSADRKYVSLYGRRTAVGQEASAAVSQPPGGPPPRRPLDLDPGKRPVVTYITRWPQYSRAVLNDYQVLKYIINRYNVTLRVTSLTEPVHAAAELLAATDVLIGAHGEGWTHAAFLKRGAFTLQLFPYGWRLPGGRLLRGAATRTLVHMRQGVHLAWVNPHAQFSFFRREDFLGGGEPYRAHPDSAGTSEWAAPRGAFPHPAWMNANTYADLNHLGPYIDAIMAQAGIPVLTAADIRRYNATRRAAQRAAAAAKRHAAELLTASKAAAEAVSNAAAAVGFVDE